MCCLEEGLAGHVGRGGDAHELEHGGGDVGQAAVAEALDIVVHGDEGHYVEGVGGVGGTVLVDCVVGVAVVGGDKHAVTVGPGGLDYLGHALVHGLDGLADGLVDSGVAYHITVGEVEDDHVVYAFIQLGYKSLSHLGSGHLGLEVVGGHLGGVDEDAGLALERLLASAGEEEGHMGVFLGLGDAELPASGLGDYLADGVGHVLLVEEDVQSGELVVVGGQAAVVQGDGLHALLRHVLLGEHCGDLAGAVVAEVVEDDGIALGDESQGLAGGIHAAVGLYELVGHALVVGALHGGYGVGELLALTAYDQVVGHLDTVPPLVAVHGVVAADDAGDDGTLRGIGVFGTELSALGLQLLYEALAAAGVAVAAVHEAVDIYLGQLILCGHLEELVEVCQGAVDSAVGAQSEEVQGPAAGGHIVVCCFDFLVFQKFVLAAGHVDLDQVLINDAARADVEVSHLGVAHLSGGKTHVLTAGFQKRYGVLCPELVEIGSSLSVDGVGAVMPALAPAVEDHK